MFFSISCNVGNYFLSFPHFIVLPTHEWSWFHWQFQFCSIVSHDENLRICHFLRIDITRSPWSITKCFSVPLRIARFRQGRISSWPGRTFCTILPEVLSCRPQSAALSWFQFSTLEKTKHGRHPILNNLLKRSFPWIAHGSVDWRLQINLCLYRVALIYLLLQLISMDVDFRNVSSPGLLKLKTIREMASWQQDSIIRSRFCCDSFFSWILLRIASPLYQSTVELKWLIVNKHNKWFHSSRGETSLWVRVSASWFLVSMYLIWILESRLIRSNSQSRATLWVLETCLIVGLSALNDHLDHSFIVLKTHTIKLLDARIGHLREHYQYSWARWSSHEIFDFFQISTGRSVLSETRETLPKTETLRSHNSRAWQPV